MAQTAPAADKPTIILLSTPFGTGSYVLGTAMESIVNQGDYPVTVSHAETPGQAFNVMKLGGDEAARKNTVVVATSGIEWLAQRGMKPFKQTYEPLKVIGTLNYAITWLVTTDKSIKTMADLHGKRIALGRVPQIVWGYEPDALLRNGYTDEFYKSLRNPVRGPPPRPPTPWSTARWTPPSSAATSTPSTPPYRPARRRRWSWPRAAA
jgi:hypothetical protein